MHTTLLDKYIGTCSANASYMPVYRGMKEAIETTHPVAHRWTTADALGPHLPEDVAWPDAAMCLYGPHGGIIRGYHEFCVDIPGQGGDDVSRWFDDKMWALNGLLLFQPGPDTFDVVPLAVEAVKREVVLAEMQLHFFKYGAGWGWKKATTGVANGAFHNYFVNSYTDAGKRLVDDGIEYLGNIVSLFLGAYWKHINRPGDWYIRTAKAPKVKKKGGKTVKVYKPGTAGYKQFIPSLGLTLDEARRRA